MNKKIIILITVVFIIAGYGDFNRTSGLIDMPTAHILPHFGYRAGLDGSMGLGSADLNEGLEGNLHFSIGFKDRVECYLDIYSFNNFTTAIGFCHNFLKSEKLALAWGIHHISYALDVSELGHGDSTGWSDDLMYYGGEYEKPFELGSAYINSTYSPSKFVDATIGLGRGKYVGYGTHSHFFNSNFYHEKGGDWGIGLFAGIKFKLTKDLAFIFEGDSRDLNFGLTYWFLPVEIGFAISKFEWFLWSDGETYQPRLSASLSYVNIREEPKPGIIAGSVLDTEGRLLAAEIGILDSDIPKKMTDPGSGSYRFTDIEPGVYELFASAIGYIGSKKIIKVIPGRTTVCDFSLIKEIPKTGSIKGRVVDLKTDEPLVVQVSVPETDKTTESGTNGDFEFTDLAPNIYDIKAEALDYETGFYPIVVYEGKQSDMLIKMVKRGMVITLQGVKFDLNKATLRPESYPILDDAAAIITNHPEILVEIQGHTCLLGSDVYNLKLSGKRANSVREYLIMKHMIEPYRLTAQGYGEKNPVADNKTESGRVKNRRVDFVILQ